MTQQESSRQLSVISPAEVLALVAPDALRGVTLRRAVSSGVSLRRIAKQDIRAAHQAAAVLVSLGDAAAGGRMTQGELEAAAKGLVSDFPNLSIQFIALAIRRGIMHGEVFGKVTYDRLCKWVRDAQEEVREQNENDHLSRGR